MLEHRYSTHMPYVWDAWAHLGATTSTTTTVTSEFWMWTSLQIGKLQTLPQSVMCSVFYVHESWSCSSMKMNLMTVTRFSQCCVIFLWFAETLSIFACWTVGSASYQDSPFSQFWATCHKSRVSTLPPWLSQVRLWSCFLPDVSVENVLIMITSVLCKKAVCELREYHHVTTKWDIMHNFKPCCN